MTLTCPVAVMLLMVVMVAPDPPGEVTGQVLQETLTSKILRGTAARRALSQAIAASVPRDTALQKRDTGELATNVLSAEIKLKAKNMTILRIAAEEVSNGDG